MSNTYLSGAYPGGYTLSAKYSGLVIEAGASVGGTGVSAALASAGPAPTTTPPPAAGPSGPAKDNGGLDLKPKT